MADIVGGWDIHRRKLLLGPGAQAPPPTFMIMGFAYMTSPPWPFPTLKYKYIFQIKNTEISFIKLRSETVMV